MTEYWLDQRQIRLEADGPGAAYPVAHKESASGGIAYVRNQFLTHAQDFPPGTIPAADHDRMTAGGSTAGPGWLDGTELELWVYSGPDDLLEHVARLRQARRGDGVASPRAAVHYVLTGEPAGGVPRGGPAGIPLAAALPAALAPWAGQEPTYIAVLDTGLDAASPMAVGGPNGAPVEHAVVDVDELLLPAAANLGGAPGPSPLGSEAGHGTFIASIINRMSGGQCRIRMVKVLDVDGVTTEQTLVEALKMLRTHDGDVPEIINLSLGGFTDNAGWDMKPEQLAAYEGETLLDHMPLALGAELELWRAEHPETVFVAAAGNDGQHGRPFWPAAAAETHAWDDPPAGENHQVVIAVGSLSGALQPSSFTNTGPWVTLSTLGEDILGDFPSVAAPDGRFPVSPVQSEEFPQRAAHWSGTSFATPLVVAEIARNAAALAANPPAAGDLARRAAIAWLSGLAPHAPVPAAVAPPDPAFSVGLEYDPRATGPVLDPRTP